MFLQLVFVFQLLLARRGCRSEMVNELTVAQARGLMRAMPGVTAIDHRADEGYVTPLESSR